MFRVILVTSLGKPSSLVVLFVQVNSIGDEGTIALAEALKVSFVFFRECSSFPWLLTHLF